MAAKISNVENTVTERNTMNTVKSWLTTIDGATCRVVGNLFIGNEEEAVMASLVSRKPEAGDRIFTLDMGDMVPRLLIERLAALGIKARVTIIPKADMARWTKNSKDSNFIAKMVDKHNFVWANAEYSFWLKMEGIMTWGLEPLGLKVKYGKKLSKRLQEVLRYSRYTWYTADNSNVAIVDYDQMVMSEFTDVRRDAEVVFAHFTNPPEDVATWGKEDADKLYDGGNVVSYEFLESVGFKDKRGSLRVVAPFGLIKGDFIARPRSAMGGADIMFHTENLKDELATNGWTIVTLNEHHATYMPTLSQSVMNNNQAAFPHRQVLGDMVRLYKEAMKVLDADLPSFVKLPALPDHNGTGIEIPSMVDEYTKVYHRIQAVGLNLDISQNLMFLISNGITLRTGKEWWDKDDYGNAINMYRKMWIPASNAVAAGVLTYSFMTKMAGFKFSDHDGTKSFFMEGYGWVLPDERFIKGFELHSTEDLDDTNTYCCRKFWSSDPAYTALLVADGVLDPSVEIPDNADDAVEGAFDFRIPDGAGEYTIEFFEGEIPWHNPHENIVVINLVDLPRGQMHLLHGVEGRTIEGLPEDRTVYGGAFTKADATYMVRVQTKNPGIGRATNAMMCWSNVMGTSFPPHIVENFGNMVDAVEQGCNEEQFAAVLYSSALTFGQLITAMEADPTLVIDKQMAVTRMPADVRKQIRPEQIVEGRFTKQSSSYRATHLQIKQDVGQHVLETRQASDLVKWVQTVPVIESAEKWAKDFHMTWRKALASLETNPKFVVGDKDSAFLKVKKQQMKSAATQEVVEMMLKDASVAPDANIFALYQYLVTPHTFHTKWGVQEWPEGLYDRVMFQSTRGGDSVFDRMIPILRMAGQAY